MAMTLCPNSSIKEQGVCGPWAVVMGNALGWGKLGSEEKVGGELERLHPRGGEVG